MFPLKLIGTALAAGLLSLSAGCSADSGGNASASSTPAARIAVTIHTATGTHVFNAEAARTPAEQERGYMYRTDLGPESAMLFAPYPPEGGAPREATFWMKNTPTSLDILFIRADGTIARIAEDAVPYSEDRIPSGEPIAAVLEIVGGRSAELGIAEGDRVTWPGQGR